MAEKAKKERPNADSQMAKDILGLVLTFVGVIGGHLIYKGANKVFKMDARKKGIKAIPPAILLLGGAGGAYFLHKKDYKLLGNAAAGLAFSGGVHTANVMIEKNILSGLKGVENDAFEVMDEAVSEQYPYELPELNYAEAELDTSDAHEDTSHLSTGKAYDEDIEDAEML